MNTISLKILIQKLRSLDNLYLLEFKEQTLKSYSDFETAFQTITSSKLNQYLKRYCILLPGDHPAQFYARQIIYKNSYPERTNSDEESNRLPTSDQASILNQVNVSDPSNDDHCNRQQGATNSNVLQTTDHSTYHLAKSAGVNLEKKFPIKSKNTVQGLVSFIGGLHIELNAQEDIIDNYHRFFKYMYKSLFKGSRLAENPKPWRRTLLFDIFYGGWTLIRSDIKEQFKHCKSLAYGILLTLLDSYIPLSLTIHAVTFKLSNFKEFYNAIIRMWSMFYCFRHKHYDKNPLVWLSHIIYWKEHNPKLYETVVKNLCVTDEHPVENTHSIIRGNTNPFDSPATIIHKAKTIFTSRETQHNLRSTFTPPKNYTFSRSQLKYLNHQSSKLLFDVFQDISEGDGSIVKQIFPEVLSSDSVMLPIGFHCLWPPNPAKHCDLPGCFNKDDNEPWHIMEGCWHSYHDSCLQGSSSCPICRNHLRSAIAKLCSTAHDAIFSPNLQGKDRCEMREMIQILIQAQ